jgi:hypothetical protein
MKKSLLNDKSIALYFICLKSIISNLVLDPILLHPKKNQRNIVTG